MLWTKEKPMLPGWYWTDYDGATQVVYVNNVGTFFHRCNDYPQVDRCKCNWSERIEEPFAPPEIDAGIIDKLMET